MKTFDFIKQGNKLLSGQNLRINTEFDQKSNRKKTSRADNNNKGKEDSFLFDMCSGNKTFVK